MKETRSTCPYCGVGCGVIIASQDGQITGVRGDPDHPANFGRLCTKGSTLHLTAAAPVTWQARLLQPQRRDERGQAPRVIGWEAALDEAANRFANIIDRNGPDAVGFYISGQLLTEDYYVFNKLAKGLIGTNNVDTNSRLCMSSAVAGYKQTLGADAPPSCYEDIDHADLIFIVGANTAYAHPILFRRIEDAKRANPNLKLIVADPRRTETAEIADLHLPLLPGTDVALFHGLLHLLMWEGHIDHAYVQAHTTGFDALKTVVRDYDPRRVAAVCGLDEAALAQAAQWFGEAGSVLSLYCQGLNQSSSGTAKNAALINLHLATGQIGRPGAGPFSLTGQPNAMGGREVGGLANLLSAHRDLANPEHRDEVARLWGVRDVPAAPGKTAVEMFEAAADGAIKALWISCTNPAQSLPDQRTVRRALERAEYVVVQEAYATTATCAYADLLLPASTWGEKEGTVTNSERRISRVRAAVPPAGQARPDWLAVVEFARRLEQRLPQRLAGRPTLFPYQGVEDIWNEHRETTRGRDLDITGLSYALLDRHGPQQWPCPASSEGEASTSAPPDERRSFGRARLYEDGVFPTPDGRARFVAIRHEALAEPRDARYPFSLTTGRLRDHWHGMSRTGTLGRLFGHVPEPAVQLNPGDMTRRGLKDGDLVYLTSRRGSVVVPAQASEQVAPAQAFLAMHWGEEFLSGCSSTGEPLTGVNALTTSAFCPTSKQPELKHAAIKVLKAELPWSLLGAAWLPHDKALAARDTLRSMMRLFPFATCVPFGREPSERQVSGLLFRAAAHEAPPPDVLTQIEGLLGLSGTEVLRYHDVRRGQRRAVRLERRGPKEATLQAFVLAGDTSAEAWIKTLLQDELPAQAYGRLLLVPGAKAPVAVVAKGRQVCTCFNVTQPQIETALGACSGNAESQLAQLQEQLKCGTNCGSCVPELKRLVRAQLSVA
ncbi:nitrate reductase [Caldimonas brevitalea]|uniref:Nitrate reductase n=1 Tax=Caldimonas brevitalea TaxID=413882 RepID=A0A0G3BRF9_9BURK|nr:nitrate reductase [Caldimonas brevitalea]AKJ29946.1 nitrate reductase [Caldimonas brevitalea]